MTIISVGALTKYIKTLFDRDETLSSLFVRGEVSNFKRHSSGHCYFVLKDSQAAVRCVMFKGRAQHLKFVPKDGMSVLACGQVTVFERDGQYQFYIERLIPDGVGEIGAAFEQLKEKLAQEGLFEQTRKKPLPLLPQAVGVITSPTGAALRDIFSVATRRHPGLPLILCPVQVQGAEAARQIAEAIASFNRLKKADVLIVGRGGGSIEELWAFNEEITVRAIAASNIPVVSAVGHETDYTLADFAADKRAATPSQAAEIVVPDKEELERYVKVLAGSLTTTVRGRLQNKRNLAEKLRASHVFARPDKLLADKNQELDELREKMEKAARQNISQKAQAFKMAAAGLDMLNPLAVLARGYSVVKSASGRIITRADEAERGQSLEIILKRGRLDVEVTGASGADYETVCKDNIASNRKEGNNIG